MLQIWDAVRCRKIRTMGGHRTRVGTLAWSSHTLSSGSRDRNILQRDVRAPADFSSKLVGHKSEVCGLKWSYDDKELASGGMHYLKNIITTSIVNAHNKTRNKIRQLTASNHKH
jgi:cell division cycle 20-like protein 1 (cofactor of APC complex)